MPPAPQEKAPGPRLVPFQVRIAQAAEDDLDAISDVSTREVIVRRAFELDTEPNKQGKALTDELKGYRSVRAAGQRYWVVYEVLTPAEESATGMVMILVVGIRKAGDKKDVYRVAARRLG